MTRRRLTATLAALTLWAGACDAGEHAAEDPCQGVTCGDHGVCAVSGGRAACYCDGGYVVDAGGVCEAAASACAEVSCGEHGFCVEADGAPRCVCEGDQVWTGSRCAAPESACDAVDCGTGICVVANGERTVCLCEGERHFDATLATCVGPTIAASPCDDGGVECGEHGACVVAEGRALCLCEDGYRLRDGVCAEAETDPESPCASVSCGEGFCVVDGGGAAQCVCAPGYRAAEGPRCELVDLCMPGARICSPEGDALSCSEEGEWRIRDVCEAGCSAGECVGGNSPDAATLDERGGTAAFEVQVGGEVATVELTVAPGAITDATIFTVEQSGVGGASSEPEQTERGDLRLLRVHVEPSGTVFSAAATLSVRFDASTLESETRHVFTESLTIEFLDPEVGPVPVPTVVRTEEGRVTAALEHLSEYQAVANVLEVDHAPFVFDRRHSILLVHGWSVSQYEAAPGPRNSIGSLEKLAQLLVAAGGLTSPVTVYRIGYNSTWGIENAAYWVGQALKAIRERGAVDVDVVAHSMGGLATRALIEGFARERHPYCSVARAVLGLVSVCDEWELTMGTRGEFAPGDLRRLVTLATPHGGASTAVLVGRLDANVPDFGARDMLPYSAIIAALRVTPRDLAGPAPDYVVIRADGDHAVAPEEGSLLRHVGAASARNVLEYGPVPSELLDGTDYDGWEWGGEIFAGTHNMLVNFKDAGHPAYPLVCQALGLCGVAPAEVQAWACDTHDCYPLSCPGELCAGACPDLCGAYGQTCGDAMMCVDPSAPRDAPPRGEITSPAHLSAIAGPFTVAGVVTDDSPTVTVTVELQRDGALVDWGRLSFVTPGHAWSVELDPTAGAGGAPVPGLYDLILTVDDGVNPAREVDAIVVSAARVCGPYCDSPARLVTWGGAGIPPTRGVVDVGGFASKLLVRGDGEVVSWGGRVQPPLSGVARLVAMGGETAIVLRDDGSVIGRDAAVPDGLTDILAIAGDQHALALRADGTVVTWGTYGTALVPTSLTDVLGVAAARSANFAQVQPCSYAVRDDGTVAGYGQACPSTATWTDVAAIAAAKGTVIGLQWDGRVIGNAALTDVAAISAGDYAVSAQSTGTHFLALSETGAVFAWGTNALGEAVVPNDVGDAIAVEAANGTSVVLRRDGAVRAWGTTSLPDARLDDLVEIARGSQHQVGLREDGSVVVWGENAYGQLDVPADVRGVAHVVAGSYHSLALLGTGRVVAWGGVGRDDGATDVPSDLGGVLAIAARSSASYALGEDGVVVGWGQGASVPAGLTDVVALSSGDAPFAVRRDGTVVALGSSPAPPGYLAQATAVSGGSSFGVALREDGGVTAWGSNSAGQTVVPPGLSGVVAVAAGSAHALALTLDGTVVGWGSNVYGQLDVPADLASYDVEGIGAYGTMSYALVRGPRPSITAVSATSVAAGATLVVSGGGFERVSSVVVAGGVARWRVVDAQTLEVTVPAHGTVGPVRVDNAWGTAVSAETVTVTP